jgi:hypothetical protein
MNWKSVMEVAKRLWISFANAVGAFLDEAGFRMSLAWAILVGRVPIETEKRFWNRNRERPVLIDVYSWVDDRRIFSVLVWPALEEDPHDADYVFRERVDEVKEAIAKGCGEKSWSTHFFETDWGLRWDQRREVWVDEDGYAYDGSFARFASARPRVSALKGEGDT